MKKSKSDNFEFKYCSIQARYLLVTDMNTGITTWKDENGIVHDNSIEFVPLVVTKYIK